MSDSETTVAQLRDRLWAFASEREWFKFHKPKNLAMAIAIEAAELMEHFQWVDVGESEKMCFDQERLDAVSQELADVICYALSLANVLAIDVSNAVAAKVEHNSRKYPADAFRGRYERA